MKNTKARHQEIVSAAVAAIKAAGGVEAIDSLGQDEKPRVLLEMAMNVVAKTDCTKDTARRNIVVAVRQARHPFNDLDRWGGPRPSAGRPPMDPTERRVSANTRLAPGSKELAQAIAEVLELPGWGRAVDQALVRMVEGDQELKAKLAKMGIIVKKFRDEKC